MTWTTTTLPDRSAKVAVKERGRPPTQSRFSFTSLRHWRNVEPQVWSNYRRFWCIHRRPADRESLVPERSDDQAHCPGPNLPSTRIRCGDHSAVRALVHCLSAVIPEPGGIDSRAWGSGGSFDDPPVSDPVPSGIREAGLRHQKSTQRPTAGYRDEASDRHEIRRALWFSIRRADAR